MASVEYISWIGHGTAIVAPPGVFVGATAHLFAFEADVIAMQHLVDVLLNPASPPPIHYECTTDISFVTFMDIAQCSSSTDAIGWVPGRECAIWVPIWERHPDDPTQDRPVLWAPYVFIDYAIGMAIGREVWGWPKMIAEIEMPSQTGDPAQYTCSTTVFPTFSAQTEGQHETLLSVAADKAFDITIPPIWQDGVEAARHIFARASGSALPDVSNPLGADLTIPSVVLKQFPDSANPLQACFQGVANSPLQVTQFNGGGLHVGTFALSISTCDSHQIVQDLLGQKPDKKGTTLPILFAAWLKADFRALDGSLVGA